MELIGDVIAEVVATLEGAGLYATSEPSRVQIPGALVAIQNIVFDILDADTYTAVIDIYLLTSNKGAIQSLNDLQLLLNKFRTVYPVPEAVPVSFNLPNIAGNDPVPGLQITLEATITKD